MLSETNQSQNSTYLLYDPILLKCPEQGEAIEGKLVVA